MSRLQSPTRRFAVPFIIREEGVPLEAERVFKIPAETVADAYQHVASQEEHFDWPQNGREHWILLQRSNMADSVGLVESIFASNDVRVRETHYAASALFEKVLQDRRVMRQFKLGIDNTTRQIYGQEAKSFLIGRGAERTDASQQAKTGSFARHYYAHDNVEIEHPVSNQPYDQGQPIKVGPFVPGTAALPENFSCLVFTSRLGPAMFENTSDNLFSASKNHVVFGVAQRSMQTIGPNRPIFGFATMPQKAEGPLVPIRPYHGRDYCGL